jgi:hypothetical protein
MARKPTDIVAITLRVREGLRRKLHHQAEKREVSLNNEMVRRLEGSFEHGSIELLFDAFTGSPENSLLLAIIASALIFVKRDKTLKDDKERSEFAAAVISKIVQVYLSGEELSRDAFPDHAVLQSVDSVAALCLHIHTQFPYQHGG